MLVLNQHVIVLDQSSPQTFEMCRALLPCPKSWFLFDFDLIVSFCCIVALQ